MSMTVGSLFAGIGGFELAAIQAGFTPLWSNEIDKHACKILRKNFTHEIIQEDIKRLSFNPNSIRVRNGSREVYRTYEKVPERHDCTELNSSSKKRVFVPYVDVITGGFPCQPFSTAGKRLGEQDDRFLWFEMLRLISEIRPKYVIAENVSGILSMEDGDTFEKVCSSLESEGYEVQSCIIPAASVGAWHKRDRVWIIGSRIPIDTDGSSDRTECGTSGKAIEDAIGNGSKGCPRNIGRTDQSFYTDTDTDSKRPIRSAVAGSDGKNRSKSVDEQLCRRNTTPGNDPKCIESNEGTVKIPTDTECGVRKRPGRYADGSNSTAGPYRETDRPVDDLSRKTESGVRRMVDGLPNWMDGHHPDPTTTEQIKGRSHRLKGLGNAIVPQVAIEIFKAIKAVEDAK